MLSDIVADIIVLLVIPVIGLIAAFGDEKDTLKGAFAIFAIFIICALLVML